MASYLKSSKSKGSVPTTKKGKAEVKKLGRTKKTGGFAKICKISIKRIWF